VRTKPYDVVIIGGGSAGLAAMRTVREHTSHFVVINDGPWGTTCARTGCQPSKLLIEAANAFHARSRFGELGLKGAQQLRVDSRRVLMRVRRERDAFVRSMVKESAALLSKAISGRAEIIGPHLISIDGKTEIAAKRIIVATGSSPILPEPMCVLGQRLLTTDSLFELDRLPKRMAVLGQGPLGIEMAQALARLGVKVTAFEPAPKLAGLHDAKVSAVLAASLRKEYAIHLGTKASLVSSGASIVLRAGRATLTVDAVLAALGRKPNVEGLGLENAGLTLDAEGLPKVNRRTMQAGRSAVFFAGDVQPSSAPPVLHEARDEGRIAGLNAVARTVTSFRRKVPLVIVFTDPNIAAIGQRFDSLESSKVDFIEADVKRVSRSRIALTGPGLLRVAVDRTTKRLLGAELAMASGEHLAHWLALAIERGSTTDVFDRAPLYHPTFEEVLAALSPA